MKILFIGNSHTYFNDMPEQVARMIAATAGEKSEVVMLAYRGRELAWHREEYFSNADLENLCLRFELRTTDNAPAGLTMINDFANVEKDSDNTYEFEMDFEGLVTGSYFVCLVLYQANDVGSYLDLDAVYPALSFDIRDLDNKIRLDWSHSNWGHIRFEDIKLLH